MHAWCLVLDLHCVCVADALISDMASHVRLMGFDCIHLQFVFPPPTLLERLGFATDAASSLLGSVIAMLGGHLSQCKLYNWVSEGTCATLTAPRS